MTKPRSSFATRRLHPSRDGRIDLGVEPKELDFQGVYRLATDGSLTLIVDDLSRPNGIAFSPDQSILYVANSDGANQSVVMAYDVEPDGGLSNARVFFNSWGDGMAVDQQVR